MDLIENDKKLISDWVVGNIQEERDSKNELKKDNKKEGKIAESPDDLTFSRENTPSNHKIKIETCLKMNFIIDSLQDIKLKLKQMKLEA